MNKRKRKKEKRGTMYKMLQRTKYYDERIQKLFIGMKNLSLIFIARKVSGV